MKRRQNGYSAVGEDIAKACQLRGWSMRQVAEQAGIPTSRMDRIVHGARIRLDDGLILCHLLQIRPEILAPDYGRWKRGRASK